MNLVKEKQGGLVPPGLKRWPFKLIKHFAGTTCVPPSPAGPAGCCPLNFLNLINLKFRGDQQLIIATYPMSQKLRGAPRLLFGNGCFWLDDIAEVKKKISLQQMQNLIFFKLVCSLLPDVFILCFLDQKVKMVISNLNQDGVFPKYGSHYTTCNSWKKSGWRYVFSFRFPLLHVLAWT